MKKYISFKLAGNESEFEMPTSILADHLCDQMAQQWPDLTAEEVRARCEAVLATDDKLFEYFRLNASWQAFAGVSRMVSLAKHVPIIDDCTGAYDDPKSLEQPTGISESLLPLGVYLSLMWQKNARVSATVFEGNDGKVGGALILVTGDADQVQAYLQVCSQLCQQMNERPEGAPKPPRLAYNH